MSERISTSDVHSSTSALTCLKSELPNEALKHKEETIIYVSDELGRPYILLKDINGELYWRPYGGEPIEQIRIFHKWELKAQEILKEKIRSQEEIDELRNILMAISVVTEFFEFEDQMRTDMIGALLTKLSIRWYCKDNNLKSNEINLSDHEEGLNTYFSLVSTYVHSFYNTMQEVRESVNQQVSS